MVQFPHYPGGLKTLAIDISVLFNPKGFEEFLNSDEIMMERRRGLLARFDIRLQAHSDRLVIQDLIPEQVIWRKNAAVSGSASHRGCNQKLPGHSE